MEDGMGFWGGEASLLDVKLTSAGREQYRAATGIEPPERNGFTKMTLREFAQVFGPDIAAREEKPRRKSDQLPAYITQFRFGE